MPIDYYQQQFGEDVYEPAQTYSSTDEQGNPIYDQVAPAAPSDEQILAFVQANIDNPALIAETAAQYGVSVDDLSRATGYDANVVVNYFQQADVAPPSIGGLATTVVDTTAATTTATPTTTTDVTTSDDATTVTATPITTTGTTTAADTTTTTATPTTTAATTAATTTASETKPAATTTATTATTALPTVTDHQGNQYDGAQLLTLARQI